MARAKDKLCPVYSAWVVGWVGEGGGVELSKA